MGFDGLDPDFVQFLHEKFPVLSLDYGLYRSTEHLHSVFFQNPAAMKFHSAVEGGLSSECEQKAVRTFLPYDLLCELRGYGQEIDLVRHPFRSLHRGDVRIQQHSLHPFFP